MINVIIKWDFNLWKIIKYITYKIVIIIDYKWKKYKERECEKWKKKVKKEKRGKNKKEEKNEEEKIKEEKWIKK